MRGAKARLVSAFAVVLVAALGSAGTAGAVTNYNSSHSHVTSIATRVLPAAQISATQEAHRKALHDKAYTDAILAKNIDQVRAILIKNGAPADVAVRINDKRHPGATERAKPGISITVTCCPLTITISIS